MSGIPEHLFWLPFLSLLSSINTIYTFAFRYIYKIAFMMIIMAFNYDNKITYPELVMDQIKTIQKICSKELRDGDKVLKNAMGEQIIEGDDTRYSFLQSVEILGSMLSPYFNDSDIEFDDFCEYYDAELVEIIDDEKFKNKIKDIFSKDVESVNSDEKFRSQVNVFLLNDKIKEGRKMFRKLIGVFKNNNFLGETAFGDSSSSDGQASLEAVENDEEDLLENETTTESNL